MSAVKKETAVLPVKRDQEVLKQAESIESANRVKRGFFYASEQKNYARKIQLYQRDPFMLIIRAN